MLARSVRLCLALSVGAMLVGTMTAASLAETVIVDNSDSGFSVISGTWSTGNLAGQYGSNHRYKNTRTSSPYNYVQWRPTLSTGGSYEVAVWYPPSSSRPDNASFTVHYQGGSQTIAVDMTVNPSTWVVLGTFSFSAGTSGYVELSDQARRNRTIVADAVRFSVPQPVDLTMAVSPEGAGTTTPAIGGPYTYWQGDVVSISAIPASGWAFDHWAVSAGAGAAAPNWTNTTVIMDQSKTVTAVFVPPKPEFRAVWADVFHVGFQNATQVDQMISMAVQGRYNAIIPEVLAYHDAASGSHGAFWRSNIVTRSSLVTDTFDPLGYMVEQAHAHGIEVHPWLVAFRVSTAWPPPGNSYLAARPHWLMVPQASMGTVASLGGYYTLDPGSPDVQEYLTSIVRELVTNYAVDGIHWDYIRYTQTDAGYPADTAYTRSTLARFKQITGRTDVPSPGDSQWSDFRRRTITELVRRPRAEIPTISNPRQPIRYSASLVTWYPANTNFHLTRPYYDCYSDWEYWMSMGYLDASVPMCYFDEEGSYTQTYRAWVDNSVTWAYDRHVFIGPGIYMNSFSNSVIQLQYARDAGVHGYSTYSYNVTNNQGVTWVNWYPYVASNFFTSPATVPPMPWRNPATAVEGTLYGRVLNGGVTEPVDDATVQIGSVATVRTDGNGYYVATLIPATASGTSYSVTASKTGMPTTTLSAVSVLAGSVVRQDLILSELPVILQQPQNQQVCAGQSASFTVHASGQEPLYYQWRKGDFDLEDGGNVSGALTESLVIANADASDVASYACQVTDSRGSVVSNPAALALKTATAVTMQPQPQVVQTGGTAVFTVTAEGSGTKLYQWQKNGQNLSNSGQIAGATTATLTIQPVVTADVGTYRCVVSAGCGPVASESASLSLSTVPGDFDGDGDVDQKDFGRIQTCLSGSTVAQNAPECMGARFDGDSDVDQDDVTKFIGCLSGPDVEANPSCAF